MLTLLNNLIDELGRFCKNHHITIITAESCTGGGIAFVLSKSSECSSVLERGYVIYSNQSKESILGVKAESIQIYGSVSKEVAIEMSEGALKNSIAQVSLAITCIAGEDNDSEHKNGVAWLSISKIDAPTITTKLTFSGSRHQFMDYMIQESIVFLSNTLRSQLKTSFTE
jgi:nicotinamide-nucleotide amidase